MTILPKSKQADSYYFHFRPLKAFKRSFVHWNFNYKYQARGPYTLAYSPQTAIIMLCKCLLSPIICHYSNDRIRKWFKDVSVNIFGRNCDTYEKQKAFYPIVFVFSCPTKTQRIGRDKQVTLRSYILWHAATVIIFSSVGIKGNRIMRF